MSALLNMHILEMMASKVCHDLISPIGAVNNGLEILEEMGADGGDEVTDLIAFSAQQASAKLTAFRLAYGAGGGDGHLKAEDAYKAIELIVGAENKITQDWNPNETLDPMGQKPEGFCKILTCVLMLALDALPKGGSVSASGASGSSFIVSADGENAGLRPEQITALNIGTASDTLEPQAVHAYMCRLIAGHYGFSIRAENTSDRCIRFYVEQA